MLDLVPDLCRWELPKVGQMQRSCPKVGQMQRSCARLAACSASMNLRVLLGHRHPCNLPQ
jgi:hypothetical protein